MNFHKLENGYSPKAKFFTSTKPFKTLSSIDLRDVKEAFDFSYEMSFGTGGEHRAHRSGGTHQRRLGEIFANTFQGKLCEFAVFEILKDKYDINRPDLDTYGLGRWDDFDFKVKEKLLSIKSTKSFGHLLLLETKDWNENGEYIPSDNKRYDFTILVRIKNDPETILRRERLFYSDDVEKELLWELFKNNTWEFDIPGFISNEELKYLIKEKFIIFRGDYLNGKTKMDATNYYCQAGDMHPIDKLEI